MTRIDKLYGKLTNLGVDYSREDLEKYFFKVTEEYSVNEKTEQNQENLTSLVESCIEALIFKILEFKEDPEDFKLEILDDYTFLSLKYK